MKGSAAAVIILAITCPSSLHAGQSQRDCREGTGDLGIGEYICEGGDCTISEHLNDGIVVHRFSVEPRMTAIDTNGPSGGILKERDILVAIDGRLITTFEGGYKLANAKIGVPVVLRVRRDKRELEVKVVPRKGCNAPKLTVIE